MHWSVTGHVWVQIYDFPDAIFGLMQPECSAVSLKEQEYSRSLWPNVTRVLRNVIKEQEYSRRFWPDATRVLRSVIREQEYSRSLGQKCH